MLGVAVAALPWIKRFGPWIAVGLVAIGVYAAGSFLIKDWKKSIHKAAYEEGMNKERSRQDAIARKIEAALAPRLQSIEENTAMQLNQQSQKESSYVEKINTIIKDNPVYSQCLVDDGVLVNRNEIRRSLEATINPSGGTGTGGTP